MLRLIIHNIRREPRKKESGIEERVPEQELGFLPIVPEEEINNEKEIS